MAANEERHDEGQREEQQDRAEPRQPQPAGWRQRLLRTWRWLRPILVLILVLTAFRSAVADWNDVPSGSMIPTILPGDRIFVNKLAYDLKVPYTTWRLARWGDPRRGDIVVLFSPRDGTRLVKRVVGVPGDTIAMQRDRLYINGQPAQYAPLEQGLVNLVQPEQRAGYEFAREVIGGMSHPVMAAPGTPALRSFGPVTIPPGKYLVMGDNRDHSLDSRHFGLVDRGLIVGEALGVVLSLDKDDHYLPRTDRFFSALP